MNDIIISNGLIVDGTGAPGMPGDILVSGGRIAEIGERGSVSVPSGAERIDADGLVVAPGFIDVHTHYDAQAFWDTTLSPSPLHGVTSVFGGNCGFTIAPLTEQDGDYLMRMLARVEGMPLESLQEGVPWNWRTTGEYLNALDGTLMPNAGFMVGHSAIRRVVMHDDATQRHATAAEIEQMKSLLRDGLAAGGMGFSSTWSASHNDHTGAPVPSRAASREEVIELCRVTGEFPGTTLEFIPQVGRFTTDTFEMMGDMSAAANRPLNWNLLQVYGVNWDDVVHQLGGYEVAEQRGGKVIALTIPDSFRLRLNLRAGFVLDILNGWDTLMALPPDEKLAMLRDPIGRARMDELAQSTEGNLRTIGNWAGYRLLEVFSAEYKHLEGRIIGEVAAELNVSSWDLLCDIAIADNLNTVIANQDRGQDDESWRRRVEVWRDGRAIIGASDAGAHLDMIDTFAFSTTVLGKAYRERGLISVEEGVHYLTGAPAALYGLKQRGQIQRGWHADLAIFDPTRVGVGEVYTKFDLPAGAGRVYAEADGIEHVLVNGVPVVRGRELLAARPGTLLRSGRDTDTVTAR
jgi:N-acyl-D-aspartate/D-glutamate deacylase